MNTERNLRQTATWWATTPDGFGGDTFAAPIAIKCRWEDRNEVIPELAGLPATKEKISKAIVYVDRDMVIGDYLGLGDLTASANPTLVTGPLKVQAFNKVTDLRNVSVLRRAKL